MIAILDNIRSLYNVGSIFRTADALGVAKLYLTGATGHPHPDEPWRRDHLALKKTALGAEMTVPWEYVKNPIVVINQLKNDGYQTVSLELTADSLPLTDFQKSGQPIALVVANEVTGVSNEILAVSDVVIHIPMRGSKESLNVSVAFALGAFWLSR